MARTRHDAVQWIVQSLLPRSCPCGAPGTHLCSACHEALAQGPVRIDHACSALQFPMTKPMDRYEDELSFSSAFPVWCVGPHEGALKSIVLDFKNGGHFALAPLLGAHLGRAVEEGFARCRHPHVLVAAPSTRAAVVRRGERHTELLVEELGRMGLGSVGPRLRIRGESQHSQNRRDRVDAGRRRLSADNPRAMEAVVGAHALIVDDVVTTGGTLRSIAQCLAGYGIMTCGAVTVGASAVGFSRSPLPGAVSPSAGLDGA